MLALKKKREAEKKAAEEAGGGEKVSVLGIGGKAKVAKANGGAAKKRTPGEIRIQVRKIP